MPQPILYVAVTNHGFGHATRTASVVAAIQARCPDATIIMTTSAPRWLLESYIPGEFIHRPRAFDVGVIQSDSVTMDKAATLEKLHHIQAQQRSIIASEVSFIRQNRVSLVLADIPPLSAPIARAAGLPCWMISNFGWDFIYRDWGGEFVAIADWIGECFQQCDRLFRLPFHEPMSAFSSVTDIGLTGSDPRYDAAELRQTFRITALKEHTILLSFGGLGLSQIPHQRLNDFPDWQFITFDRNAPELPNLLKITESHYRPVDFMPLCGRVISKPGYGTFAEACRLGIPIVSLTRKGFAEASVLLAGIEQHAYHQIIELEMFFQEPWTFLNDAPRSPQSSVSLSSTGNEAIAEAVADFLQTQH
jgi:hypothetical protein